HCHRVHRSSTRANGPCRIDRSTKQMENSVRKLALIILTVSLTSVPASAQSHLKLKFPAGYDLAGSTAKATPPEPLWHRTKWDNAQALPIVNSLPRSVWNHLLAAGSNGTSKCGYRIPRATQTRALLSI